MRRLNLTGQTFGLLTAIGFIGSVNGRTLWLWRCSCGTFKVLEGYHVRRGGSYSCGCQRYIRVGAAHRTHGMSHTRENAAYRGAKGRCNNPNHPAYPWYGGRGIQFRFESFEQFYAEVGPRPSDQHSLDRIDVDGHYEPGNVRWATWTEQARNRRHNVLLTSDGRTQTMAAWAEERGVPLGKFHHAFHKGRLADIRKAQE